MKRTIVFLTFLFLGIVLFSLVLRFAGRKAIEMTLLLFAGPGGIIILLFTALMILLGTVRWREILKTLGYDIPYRDLWRADFSYFAINFFAPQLFIGGEAFQSYLLSKRFGVRPEKAIASAVIERILEFTWSAVVIVVGSVFLISAIGFPPQSLFIFLGAAFVFLAVLLAAFYFKSFRRQSIVKMFIKKTSRKNHVLEVEEDVFRFFQLRSGRLWRGVFVTALKGAVNLIRILAVIFFLGKSVGLTSAVSMLGALYLALLFPIPAALGSHDALQAFVFGVLGLGRETGAALALIIRGAEFSVALVGLIFLVRTGLYLIKISYGGRSLSAGGQARYIPPAISSGKNKS